MVPSVRYEDERSADERSARGRTDDELRGALADAGVQGVFLVLPRITDPETIERFAAEVIATA